MCVFGVADRLDFFRIYVITYFGQVKQMREDLLMEADPAGVHCEGHAIKGFQTLINKRLFASKKKRVA